MVYLFVAAAAAAVFGGLALYKARQASANVAGLLGVETSTTALLHELHQNATAAAGPGAYRERVEVEGVVVAGPGGLLTSEISKTECVWHQHRVTRHYEHVRRDDEGRRRVEKRKEKVANNRSRDAFVVRDDHGEVVVVPTHNVQQARKAVSEFRPEAQGNASTQLSLGSFSLSLPAADRGGTVGYQYDEWVLTPGTRVFVSGEAVDRDGRLEIRAPQDDRILITTRSEDEVLADKGQEAKMSTFSGYGLLALAVVLAVAGVVVGIVR